MLADVGAKEETVGADINVNALVNVPVPPDVTTVTSPEVPVPTVAVI